MNPLQRAWPVFAALISGAVIFLSYRPGLHGGFLFDDFANLPALGATGPVDNWPSFLRYITSGTADPTGRPMALLSFLIDAHNWPADPEPFKRTNLYLHLLNTTLLALLLVRLGLQQPWGKADPVRAQAAGLLAATIWGLHPLFVSTTMYIVQREAMLPTTFALLGLLAWMPVRHRFAEGRLIGGWLWAILASLFCTVLATLSKANGILLPVLIWIVDSVLLANNKTEDRPNRSVARGFALARTVTVSLPAVLVLIYLFSRIPGYLQTTEHFRAWSWSERTLTEARVLWTYVKLLIVPRPYTAGLFNDQIVTSAGLWAPWTTSLAILGSLGSTFAAWRWRRHLPWLCGPWLFFMAGHLIETWIVPLELYFEHRNYLPSLLFFWPFAILITGLNKPVAIRIAISAGIIALLAGMTHARTELWGNEKEQALVWAKINPHSARATASAAAQEIASGRPDLARQRLLAALEQQPDEIQLALTLLNASCSLSDVRKTDLQTVRYALLNAKFGQALTFRWIGDNLPQLLNHRCAGLNLQTAQQMVEWASENRYFKQTPELRQSLLHTQGQFALMSRDEKSALALFNQALEQHPVVEVAIEQAAELGAARRPEMGLAHLAYFDTLHSIDKTSAAGMPSLHQWVLEHQQYWQHEEAVLRDKLLEDTASAKTASPQPEPATSVN